VSGIVGTVG